MLLEAPGVLVQQRREEVAGRAGPRVARLGPGGQRLQRLLLVAADQRGDEVEESEQGVAGPLRGAELLGPGHRAGQPGEVVLGGGIADRTERQADGARLGRRRSREVGHRRQPGGRRAVLAAHRPIPRQGGAQPDRGVRVTGVDGEAQRGQQVVPLGGQPGDPPHLLGPAQVRLRLFGESQEARRVRPPDVLGGAVLGEPLLAVLPERLQHSIAGLGAGNRLQQRLVGQGREQVGHLLRRHVRAGADPLGRVRADAAGEDRQPVGQPALGRLQQVPAPRDDGPQRPVPGQRGAAAAGEQPEPVVQPVGDLLDRHRPHPGRGQLDGQRQPVQPAADLHHGTDGYLVDGEPRPHGRGPVGEQPDRRVLQGPLRRRASRRQAERRDRGQCLAGDAERLPAGGQHPQVRTAGEQLPGRVRGRLDQVLAVVEQDQGPAAGEQVDQPAESVPRRRHIGLRSGGRQADAGQHRLWHLVAAGGRGQLGQPDPVREAVEQPDSDLAGEPGLARATRAHQRDEPVPVEQVHDGGDVGIPADKAGELGRHVGAGTAPGGRRGQGRIGAQHREVDLLQLGRGIDAELVGQPAADVLVGGQRLGLATGPVQGAEQLAARPLPQRVLGDEELQARHRGGVPPERELRLVAVLDGGEPALVQRGPGRDRPGQPVGVGERRASPQRQRLPEQVGGAGRVALGERVVAGGGEPLEPGGVGRLRPQREPVAGRTGLDRAGIGQRAAEPGHQGLQRVGLVGRWGVAPQRGDQRTGADRAAGVERQPGQQRAQPGSADLDRPAGVVLDLERAQDRHAHSSTVPGRAPREGHG